MTRSLLVSIAALAPSADVSADVAPRPSHGRGGVHGLFADETIKVDDTDRAFRLFVPDSVDLAKPTPLLFAFHGLLVDSKDNMPRYTQLSQTADREGFIIVYPNGRLRHWQLRLRQNLDVDFFDRLLEHITGRYNIDRNRIYVTGMSNGAFFAHLLGSLHSDKIAAIAAHSGGLGFLAATGLKAKRKYAVMIVHGDSDGVVPVAEAERARDRYRDEGHPVEYVCVKGLRHFWAHRAGINDRMWEFFKSHPLPAKRG